MAAELVNQPTDEHHAILTAVQREQGFVPGDFQVV